MAEPTRTADGQQRPIVVADVRPAAAPLATLGAWSTVTRAEAEEATLGPDEGRADADIPSLIALLVLVLGLIAGAWWWLAPRTGARGATGTALLSGLMMRRGAGAIVDPAERKALEELGHTAAQLLRNALQTVAGLEQAAPLRGVLRQEIDLIRQRLGEAAARADTSAGGDAASAGPLTPKQLRQRLQSAIRELHRVIKIAEGAAASFAERGPVRALPRSREEAYDLLGVNADVSDGVLKKVVDALRMSWHPDHARDEGDRQRREERTKQINVAWDLITGRRAEA